MLRTTMSAVSLDQSRISRNHCRPSFPCYAASPASHLLRSIRCIHFTCAPPKNLVVMRKVIVIGRNAKAGFGIEVFQANEELNPRNVGKAGRNARQWHPVHVSLDDRFNELAVQLWRPRNARIKIFLRIQAFLPLHVAAAGFRHVDRVERIFHWKVKENAVVGWQSERRERRRRRCRVHRQGRNGRSGRNRRRRQWKRRRWQWQLERRSWQLGPP